MQLGLLVIYLQHKKGPERSNVIKDSPARGEQQATMNCFILNLLNFFNSLL